MQLDFSGANGHNQSGFCFGNYGLDGDPGGEGSNGQSIILELLPVPGSPYIKVCYNNQSTQFALHSVGKINIHSTGGKGGKGSDGGDGRKGANGTPGRDADTVSHGGVGGNGRCL